MDTIAALAFSFQNPVLSQIDLLIDNSLLYVAIVLALVLFFERRNEKRLKIVVSLALALVVGMDVKEIVAKPRPCFGASWCPTDFSFPSDHAIIAFALMAAFLNKKSYSVFLFFALFVSFARLNMGVHDFADIAGALPLALISYYFTDIFSEKFIERGSRYGA